MTIISNSFATACIYLPQKYTISTLQSVDTADNQHCSGCILKFSRFLNVKKRAWSKRFLSKYVLQPSLLRAHDRASAVRSALAKLITFSFSAKYSVGFRWNWSGSFAVSGGAEALGVGEVVGVAGGEVVVAGAVGAGAHVDVAVVGGVEDLVDGAGLGEADDSGG